MCAERPRGVEFALLTVADQEARSFYLARTGGVVQRSVSTATCQEAGGRVRNLMGSKWHSTLLGSLHQYDI